MNFGIAYAWLRGIALGVLLLLAVAVLFAGYLSVTHWSGIGV